MKVLVDTNVLTAIVNAAHPDRRVTREAIGTLRDRGDRLIVVPQVLYELWVVMTRPVGANGFGFSAAAADTQVEKIRALFGFARDE